MLTIETSLLRLTWSVIEEAQSPNLLALTDTGLVRLLLQRISKRILLTGDEVCLLYDYISSRTALIRDMADSRFVHHATASVSVDETRSPLALAPSLQEMLKTH